MKKCLPHLPYRVPNVPMLFYCANIHRDFIRKERKIFKNRIIYFISTTEFTYLALGPEIIILNRFFWFGYEMRKKKEKKRKKFTHNTHFEHETFFILTGNWWSSDADGNFLLLQTLAASVELVIMSLCATPYWHHTALRFRSFMKHVGLLYI